MTKQDLLKKVSGIKFNGKEKTVYFDAGKMNYEQTQYLADFCYKNKYNKIEI